MNKFPCAVASAVLVALCGGSTALGQCVAEAIYCEPVGVEAFWADNCTSPNIIVRGPGRDDSVIICQEGDGYWKIAVAYEAPVSTALSLVVSGGGSANRNIDSVGVSVNDGLIAGHSVLIRFLDRIDDVRGVGYDSGDIFALLVDGTIQGDLGQVIATSIGSKTNLVPLLVEGDVHGPIWLRDPASSAGIVDMRVRGDFRGDMTSDPDDPYRGIRIEYGGIESLVVDGTIGTVGEGGAVTPVTIRTAGDIDRLVAGQIIANITAGAATLNNNPTPADIYLLRSTTLNGGTGHFIGSINARKIVEQLDIRGDLGGGVGKEAIVTLLQPVGASDTVRVGGSFKEGSEIVLAQNGLQGAILFNADQTGGV